MTSVQYDPLGWPYLNDDARVCDMPAYTRSLNTKLQSGDARVAEAINAAQQATAAAQTVDNTSWATPTLRSGWQDFGAWQGARYCRRAGMVVVQGLVKNTSNYTPTVIFNLPEGYRPGGTLMFLCLATNGTCRVDVDGAGNVTVVDYDGGAPNYVSLSGITFPKDL